LEAKKMTVTAILNTPASLDLPIATPSADGLMSAADKYKVDNIATGTAGVASFNSRTGAVTSAPGDYNASQITETSSAKILTSAERARILRANTVTRFTGSQIIGLAEMFADYAGISSATATLTTDMTATVITIANRGSSVLTITAGSGQIINGGNIALPAGTASSPSSVCLTRDPSNGSWWKR